MNEVKNLTAVASAKSFAVSQEALGLSILDLSLPSVDVNLLQTQVDAVSNEVRILFYLFIIK